MTFSLTTFMAVPRASNEASLTSGAVWFIVWKEAKNDYNLSDRAQVMVVKPVYCVLCNIHHEMRLYSLKV